MVSQGEIVNTDIGGKQYAVEVLGKTLKQQLYDETEIPNNRATRVEAAGPSALAVEPAHSRAVWANSEVISIEESPLWKITGADDGEHGPILYLERTE